MFSKSKALQTEWTCSVPMFVDGGQVGGGPGLVDPLEVDKVCGGLEE